MGPAISQVGRCIIVHHLLFYKALSVVSIVNAACRQARKAVERKSRQRDCHVGLLKLIYKREWCREVGTVEDSES
jgi:hypothetical protein